MKKLVALLLVTASSFSAQAQSGGTDLNANLKPWTFGLRGMHVYDLPSYRFDGPLAQDMYGLNGPKTNFDMGFELYLEYMFNPLIGVQLSHRRASISGASDVEYYSGKFNLTGLDGIFIWNNLNPGMVNRRWNVYTKIGLGYGSYDSEQFLLADDAPDQANNDNFWGGRVGMGLQYEINNAWRVDLEVLYNVAYDDGFDGFNEAAGSDTYLTTALGVAYTFGSKEKKPTYTVDYFGIDYLNVKGQSQDSTPMVNQSKIEDLSNSLNEQEDELEAKESKISSLKDELDALKEEAAKSKSTLANVEEVYFAFDSDRLSAEAKKSLARIAQRKPAKVVLTAYADKVGSDDYNNNLKQRRATAVKDFLMQFGMTDAQISIQMGETMPFDENDQFLNRKVSLQF
ncbi:OmpA family protein [Croceimicrobium hydrocarbonivorans]|uniref:OmpA family protein n=1 Tax=Croceimicrobium hydrocarbonivorans TaxID=2761580 RepID=A0A7H0VIF6_9FLAO|nr:OmpA family protein [Croceimicrobium hydrocarbonivorans]QNR25504.1 OmpA family protein [Croceimicrobium hydrocarbonivorans]